MTAHTDALAQVYARSLFEFADEAGGRDKIVEVAQELEQTCELARADRTFAGFLASPIINRAKRGAALRRIFHGNVTDLVLRFLLVLNDRGRLRHLETIDDAFDQLVHEAFDRVEVDVFTPGPLDRGQTDAEKIALLDAELGNSLSEFDEKLLREQNELAEKSRAASTGQSGDNKEPGAGASAKAGEGQGEKTEGEAKDGTGKKNGESAAESGEKTGDSEQQAQDSADGNDSAGGNDKVASAGSAGGDKTKTSAPADIPDGRDDDIVARQLREAAENEQDPELRDKLWEEYRNYKNRTR